MPLLRLETTVTLSKEQTRTVLGSLSKVVAGAIGKPKQYVMITISHSAMSMSGKAVGAAFVDIRSIGGLSS
jgi:phenylpyruvate tautomerase PptA (4-oxalocrotonate tautomerase family)